MADPFAAAPPAVGATLEHLKSELTRIAGTNLAGLILYGGLARGRFRPGKSDVNVVVVLREVSAVSLAAIAPALRAAWRAAGVEPMILAESEVNAAAVAFPTKFLDIKDHHIVLAGEDAFAGLEVPREAIRMRVAQQLRNLALRMRRRYVSIAGDESSLEAAIIAVARPLALDTAGLLRLAGKDVPAEDRTAAIFKAAAVAFDLDGDALARLAAMRQNEDTGHDAAELYTRVLTAVSRLADVADQLH